MSALTVVSVMGAFMVWLSYQRKRKAVCVLHSGDECVGILHFRQMRGWPTSMCHVRCTLTKPSLCEGVHALHVHANRVKGTDCATAGLYFDPLDSSQHAESHGGPHTRTRHAGDLGNVRNGFSEVIVPLRVEDLEGRSCVLHERGDDFGLGHTKTSRTSGSAGARIACGTIRKV